MLYRSVYRYLWVKRTHKSIERNLKLPARNAKHAPHLFHQRPHILLHFLLHSLHSHWEIHHLIFACIISFLLAITLMTLCLIRAHCIVLFCSVHPFIDDIMHLQHVKFALEAWHYFYGAHSHWYLWLQPAGFPHCEAFCLMNTPACVYLLYCWWYWIFYLNEYPFDIFWCILKRHL